jgi:integrative and conjugative element protein (TIGR02256 family)
VAITPDVERQIRELARASEDRSETGGILLGRGPDERGVIHVEHAGEPGEHAERRPDYFLRDRAHAEHLADAAWTDSRAVWVGEWHTHPTGPPIPSMRDLVTYAGLLDDPELAFEAFVTMIVVPHESKRWEAPRLLMWVLASRAEPDTNDKDDA